MAVPLTRELGRFIAGLRFRSIPIEALPVIRMGFTDCVGVMLSGRKEPVVRLLRETLRPGTGESTILLGGATAPAPDAALINGTAAHALDFDDVAQRGHPSTVLVPAILAEAEALGSTGEEMATAYAAGYETWAEIVRREADQHHNKGWHPTGIFGAVGAAAACASLRGLDNEKCAHAIALGASQSAGITSNFGTMTKPLHAGRAAQAGVLAARLAGAGFTAALDALEHPHGFLAAVSPAGRIDLHSPVEAGVRWKLLLDKLSVKKYPLCFCTHRALDGILDLLRETPVEPSKISRVRVSTSRRNAAILRNHRPRTGLEAKFSMEFAMAAALLTRRAGLSELTDDFVNRDDVQALLARVIVEPDDREDPSAPGYAPVDVVMIETQDGRCMEKHVNTVRGGPDLPLTPEELWAKFEDCASAGGASASARALFDAFMSLEHLPHAARLPHVAA
jgi:2-methylcitrate dehydratase PrpD